MLEELSAQFEKLEPEDKMVYFTGTVLESNLMGNKKVLKHFHELYVRGAALLCQRRTTPSDKKVGTYEYVAIKTKRA